MDREIYEKYKKYKYTKNMPDRKRSFEYLKEESKILDERIKNVSCKPFDYIF
jgi:hypothetical protein